MIKKFLTLALCVSMVLSIGAIDESHLLISAIKDNDIDTLKAIINKENINQVIDEGWNPLQVAMFAGQSDVVRFLLEHDADIYATACMSHSAITIAMNPLLKIKKDIVEMIFSRADDLSKCPLHLAVDRGSLADVKLLCGNGADLELCAGRFGGKTPLYLAISQDKLEISKFLIDAGACLRNAHVYDSGKGYYNPSPLHDAVARGSVATVEFLLKYVPVETRNKTKTPLEVAVLLGQLDCVKSLIKHGANVNVMPEGLWDYSPLYEAVIRDNLAIAKCLLENNANPNNEDEFPLHHAVRENSFDMVKLLLDYGADMDICDIIGYTPLAYAVENENLEMIALLKEAQK